MECCNFCYPRNRSSNWCAWCCQRYLLQVHHNVILLTLQNRKTIAIVLVSRFVPLLIICFTVFCYYRNAKYYIFFIHNIDHFCCYSYKREWFVTFIQIFPTFGRYVRVYGTFANSLCYHDTLNDWKHLFKLFPLWKVCTVWNFVNSLCMILTYLCIYRTVRSLNDLEYNYSFNAIIITSTTTTPVIYGHHR